MLYGKEVVGEDLSFRVELDVDSERISEKDVFYMLDRLGIILLLLSWEKFSTDGVYRKSILRRSKEMDTRYKKYQRFQRKVDKNTGRDKVVV